MTVLDEIINARRRRLEEARKSSPLSEVEEAAARRHERRDFAAAISGKGLSVIAELKQASPSRGPLRPDYRPRELAQGYEAAGAAALSVLTEEDYFRGSLTDLIDARDAVGLPVLRKDFILDDYQVYESVAAGADALLLIVAALADKELCSLIGLCELLRIGALVEVHTGEELVRALAAGARIVGINNRNLKTLEVDFDTSFRLRAKIPSACLAVSESGIKTAADLHRLSETGFDAVLIGEHLMASEDPGETLAAMLGAVEVRSQKSEVRSQKSEARSQKPEARSQKPEVRSQKPEVRSQKSEVRSQESEARSQESEYLDAKTRRAVPTLGSRLSHPREHTEAFNSDS